MWWDENTVCRIVVLALISAPLFFFPEEETYPIKIDSYYYKKKHFASPTVDNNIVIEVDIFFFFIP
jgi:hypothetical protein